MRYERIKGRKSVLLREKHSLYQGRVFIYIYIIIKSNKKHPSQHISSIPAAHLCWYWSLLFLHYLKRQIVTSNTFQTVSRVVSRLRSRSKTHVKSRLRQPCRFKSVPVQKSRSKQGEKAAPACRCLKQQSKAGNGIHREIIFIQTTVKKDFHQEKCSSTQVINQHLLEVTGHCIASTAAGI